MAELCRIRGWDPLFHNICQWEKRASFFIDIKFSFLSGGKKNGLSSSSHTVPVSYFCWGQAEALGSHVADAPKMGAFKAPLWLFNLRSSQWLRGNPWSVEYDYTLGWTGRVSCTESICQVLTVSKVWKRLTTLQLLLSHQLQVKDHVNTFLCWVSCDPTSVSILWKRELFSL